MAESRPKTGTRSKKAFQTDLALYARKCLRIVTKEPKLLPLEFNPAQKLVHERLSKQFKEHGRVRAIILKARQEGVSTYVSARFYRLATLWPFQNCVVIADKRDRGGTIFGMYERYDTYIPDEWKMEKAHYRAAAKLIYEMGSRISVETAKDTDAGRAATIHALHATELALWENAEDVWTAISAAIPKQGSEIIIESTAKGVGNLFHNMWLDATEGRSNYIPIFLPWWIHTDYRDKVSPERDQHLRVTLTPWEEQALHEGIEWEGERHRLSIEQISWRRTTIADDYRGDERAFRQEYPSTPEEAFITTGNAFFDDEALERYRSLARSPMRANLVSSGDAIAAIRSERGYLRIWTPPDTQGHYVIAADTASGRQVSARQTFSEAGDERGGKDFNCAHVFDTVSRSFVAQLHGGMAPEVFADQLYMLGRYYSNVGMPDMPERRRPAYMAVEANHESGETVLRILAEDYNYPQLHYHRTFNQRTRKTTSRRGWLTRLENRQQMLDELSQAIRENSVVLPDVDTLREFATFVRDEKTGKPEAVEGTHDDRVIPAAIALQLARDVRPPKQRKLPEVWVGTSPTGWSN